jgi:hypothetical protein
MRMRRRLRMRKGFPPQNCVENFTSEAEFSAAEDLSYKKTRDFVKSI